MSKVLILVIGRAIADRIILCILIKRSWDIPFNKLPVEKVKKQGGFITICL